MIVYNISGGAPGLFIVSFGHPALDKLGILLSRGTACCKKGAVCVRRKIYAAQTVSTTGYNFQEAKRHPFNY